MFLIEQYEKGYSSGSTVRCPACRQGRLFNKAPVTRVTAVGVGNSASAEKENQIFIKCPKCSACIGITFEN